MKVLNYKNPVTPSQRHVILLNRANVSKKPLLKSLIKGLVNVAGRNNSGRITTRFRGGGHKKKYRKINFKRTVISEGIICSIEYDPIRTANIASVYEIVKKNFFYIIAPEGLTVGDIIKSGKELEAQTGFSLPISDIPVGSLIHNVSLMKNKSAQSSRAAGTFSKLIEKTLNHAEIEQSSGEKKLILPDCYATIGTVSNEFHFLVRLGKSGRSRWLNTRPTVRGVAMNPIDHPHGGGEGKKSGKGKNLWGKPTKQGRQKK